MKLSSTGLRNIIVVITLLISSFGSGYLIGFEGYVERVNKPPEVNISREVPENKTLDFSLFWNVWDAVEANYFDKSKIIDANLLYGATKGMVAAVGDPYTVFLTPEENRVTSEDLSGNFEGVGMQIGYIGTQLAVMAPLPQSPAEKAGIAAGDFIIGIKDEAKGIDHGTAGMTIPEAVQEIRGEAGSIVNLTLLRDGMDEPLVVDVKRESIDVPSVTLEFVGESESVAHIRILKFGSETKSEWDEKVLEILKKPETEGVIVDVRSNPGGYMQAAVDLGSDFIQTGKTVVIEERANGTKSELKVERMGRLLNTPLVVLINKGSASASEILAGALKDNKGTKLVGTESFGKGTIQERKELEGGVALHITSARWLTPSGYWVNEQGLKPDVNVENNPETAEDEQLSAAIQLLLAN